MSLEYLLTAIHGLASAAWFGALVYRTFFVDPKARQFFAADQEYDRYSLHLADGMRYVVLASLLICGFSGFALLALRSVSEGPWLNGILVKIGIWLLAGGLFAYISWVYWPKRVFAEGPQRQRLHRKGFVIACIMIVLAMSGYLLGLYLRLMRLS